MDKLTLYKKYLEGIHQEISNILIFSEQIPYTRII